MGYKGQQDYTKAISFYIKSAAKGGLYSMLMLAKMYRNGEGVERNPKEAIRWLKKIVESKFKFSVCL